MREIVTSQKIAGELQSPGTRTVTKYRTISKRTVDGLSVEDKDAVFWDRELPGFGVRVYPSGSKVFVVQTRTGGKSKRITLGRHGVLTADKARKKAAETLAMLKSGQDPQAKPASTVTVKELVARYFREHVEHHCKASTAKAYRRLVDRFILPAYGHLPVDKVERDDIAELHHALGDVPCQANRVLEIGGKLFNLAEEWKLRTGGNPCKFVRKYREQRRERFLTDEEFRRLGDVLNAGGGRRLPADIRGGGDPAADADRLSAQRNRDARVEKCRSRRRRNPAGG